MGSIISCRAD